MPKGGGAIRGVEEKVSVDAFRGSGGLAVPLPIRQIRSGLVPDLTLSYDSGGGNGPFGVGWGIGLPSVSRRTDKGIPLYDDANDSDRLVVPGADEVIRELNDQGRPALGTEHVPDGEWQGDMEVWSYRPRVESGFSRIEWWRKMEAGNCTASFWRVTSNANVTSLYGFTTKSRLFDPGDSSRVFQWFLDRSFDDRGNACLYTYAKDNYTDAETQEPVASTPYLTSVKYGPKSPFQSAHWLMEFPSSWLFELRFDYGNPIGNPDSDLRTLVADCEHPSDKDRCVAPQGGPIRRDPFRSIRSGFTIASRRLCRRVLSYHAIVGKNELTHSLELTYRENPYLTKLIAITQVAWDGSSSAAFPPLHLSWSDVPDLAKARLQSLPAHALPALREVTGQHRFSWIDLDAEGAPSLLCQAADGPWLIARNSGGGRFTAPQPLDIQPVLSSTAGIQLNDVDGNGLLDAVSYARPGAGYRERRDDYRWGEWIPFANSPVYEPGDPNVQMIDTNGDGLLDLLRSEVGAYILQRSLGKEGFCLPERIPWETDEKNGPRLLFADRTSNVHLADMTGDGLSDLVRIRNGEVCFWPNLGHGRFGPQRTLPIRDEAGTALDDTFEFDRSPYFSPNRIRLLDIDGTGSTDIVYLGVKGVRCWRNQSGNGFSQPVAIAFPPVDDPSAVSVTDLLANGTSCLVIAPGSPGHGASLRFLHLAGGQSDDPCDSPDTRTAVKPHLLTRYTNHLGGEIRFHYTTSAQMCVEDRDNQRPWFTKLGFPVQVIAKVEKRDLVTGKILINAYRYRHGHFDGTEREFRGFGFVEQTDSVSYESFADAGREAHGDALGNADRAFHIPPVVTRTWYHTGANQRGPSLSQRYRCEYFSGDPEAILLPDTHFPIDLCGDEAREAVRALKGSILRQEIYSAEEDGSCSAPYSVSERSYQVRREQPSGPNRHASFFVHPDQQIDYHYERQISDPRIQHQFTLEIDAWGKPTRAAKVSYGRRPSGIARDAAYLTPAEQALQARTLVEYTIRAFSTEIRDNLHHHAPQLAEERTWEIHHHLPGRGAWFTPPDFANVDLLPEAAYTSNPTHPARRLIEHVRQSYWKADQSGPLDPGKIAIPLLPHRVRKLALTKAMQADLTARSTAAVPGQPLTDANLIAAGYEKIGADWWAASPFQTFKSPFFLPVANTDSFKNTTTQRYDPYSLLPIRITDPFGDETEIINDYRLLLPKKITDVNDSVTEIDFDTRGFVIATALRGHNNDTGDRIEAEDKIINPAQFLADPLHYYTVQGRATTRFVYDIFAAMPEAPVWQPVSIIPLDSQPVPPVWAATLARQFHCAQKRDSPIEIAVAYSDGFGEVAQTKQLTEPDAATHPRWIRSGWKLVNNKGSVVRQFDPAFCDTHRFEIGPHADEPPVPTTFYDPLQRVIARLIPHRNYRRPDTPAEGVSGHSYEKTRFGAWSQETWDANDNVLTDPLDDPDVSAFFDCLPESEIRPTWYQVRTQQALLEQHWPGDPQRQGWERSAAEQTAAHDATPGRSFLDALGKPFLTIDHHRREKDSPDQFHHTHTEHDIEGNQRAVFDAKNREVMGWEYNLLGLPIASRSMDAGARLLLHAADGQLVAEWDARGHHLLTDYDELRRKLMVTVNGQKAESYTYGKSGGTANKASYQIGRLIVQTDGAGSLAISGYDVHGQPASITRTVNLGTKIRTHRYDAQSRLIESTCGATITRSYSLSGQLVSVRSSPGGEVIQHIHYNASGQPVKKDLGRKGGRSTSTVDPSSGRLHFQITTNATEGRIQHLQQIYDPVGNLIHLRDHAQQTIYFRGQVVEPHQHFHYDSLHRLITATGREHIGQTAPPPTDWERKNFTNPQAHPSDGRQMRRYTQTYEYDEVGNPTAFKHRAAGNDWTRTFNNATTSNRLESTTVGADTETYEYDAHGNMTAMGGYHTDMRWDHRDRLLSVQAGSVLATFRYDAAGERVTKKEANKTTDYFGEFEFLNHSKDSLIIRDGHSILAVVDYRLGSSSQVRLQLSDHLGTCTTEVSAADGSIISHEEFHPYGTTSYHAQTQGKGYEAKRYRFTAKERDTSTGLSYHSARYYAPWLARWISADPSGLKDGVNVFRYGTSNPIRFSDMDGRTSAEFMEGAKSQFMASAGDLAKGLLIGVGIAATIATVSTLGAVGAVVASVATIALTGAAAVGVAYLGYQAAKAGVEAYSGRSDWGSGEKISDAARGQNTVSAIVSATTAAFGARALWKATPLIKNQLAELPSLLGRAGNQVKGWLAATKGLLKGIGAEKTPAPGKQFVDLTDFRSAHILNRHRAGEGISGRTEFPASWSDQQILHHISDVATDPAAVTGMGKWKSPYSTGVRDGIDIRVDFYPTTHPTHAGKISTAYPTNVPPNP